MTVAEIPEGTINATVIARRYIRGIPRRGSLALYKEDALGWRFMRPLKIALLSRWYAEEHRRTGGKGTVQQLAEAVAGLGHEVVVLSQSKAVAALEKTRPGELGALEVWLSPREKRRGGWTGLRDRWEKRRFGHRKACSDALDLRDFLAARGPFDALWAQCEEPDGLVAAVAARLGVALPPTLTQVYALRYDFAKDGPAFWGHAALRAAFAQATRIAADSELVARHLEMYAGPALALETLREKTRVVYHNLQHGFLAAAQADGPAPEPGRVLFLGALNEKKGAVVFLEAAARIAPATKATFAVIGDTTEHNAAFDRRWATQLAAARASGAKLELLGKLPAAEVITQIRRASVVVLPSLFDEFSRALVEALVLGCPVVTTETVGASPFVRDAKAGIVVAPADAAALANAIVEVLRHNETYAANARAIAPRLAHELSPHAIALQIARHLSEIVEAK
jgi:glycosyltransferase involved in cell wall biosynthesis